MARGKLGTALVVGGAGFLGRHIVQQLLDSRRYAAVRVFDIRPCGLPGVDERVGDLRKPDDVSAAVEGEFAAVWRRWRAMCANGPVPLAVALLAASASLDTQTPIQQHTTNKTQHNNIKASTSSSTSRPRRRRRRTRSTAS